MKNQRSTIENSEWRARSVLECGDTSPLSPTRHVASNPKHRPVRAFQMLAIMAIALISVFSFQFSALSQSYSIDWHKIAGGGGTSTGGVYSVSGTIGQPDANQQPMTGGNFSLTGGFWALISVVQTPGAPTLTIVPAGAGQATISWTPASTNWVLQESTSLSPANWTNSLSGSTNPIVVPATLSKKFYRLFKP